MDSNSPEPQVMSDNESQNQSVNPITQAQTGSSGSGMTPWIIIIVVIVFLIGGFVIYSLYLTPKLENTPATPQSQEANPTTTSTASGEVSDKDDTATIRKELDSTTLQDTSSSDSSTLNADINQL